jgi:hypothetical protein
MGFCVCPDTRLCLCVCLSMCLSVIWLSVICFDVISLRLCLFLFVYLSPLTILGRCVGVCVFDWWHVRARARTSGVHAALCVTLGMRASSCACV